MRVHIGTDHAAFKMKNYLVEKLREEGYEVIDHGPAEYDAQDDYPDYIIPTAEATVAEFGDGALGVVLGGSGNGEQIAANKVKGCRAALADCVELAELAREHNNANVISLGGRFVSNELALEIVKTFLTTKFSDEERHSRRIQKMTDYENEKCK